MLVEPAPYTTPPGEPRAAAPGGRRRGRIPWPLLALLPPLAAGRRVLRDAVDVPFWDHWALAPDIVAQAQGHFPWSGLTASHNGHRILLPRLVFLGLARISGWDVRWEQAASLLFALATLALLALLARRTFGGLPPAFGGLLLVAASGLTFSLAAWENWCWGFQLQIFMAVFFATLTALLAGRGRNADLARMLLAGSAAAFSFGAGLALYPLVVLAVLLQPAPLPRRKRLLQALVAALFGLTVIAAYVQGAPRDVGAFEAGSGLGGLRAIGTYTGAFLGRPIVQAPVENAALLGSAALGLWGLLAVHLWLRAPHARGHLLPWILLGGFSAGTGAISAVARVGLGLDQALVPRYVTLATPMRISLCGLVLLAFARWTGTGRATVRQISLAGALAAGAAAFVAWQLVGQWSYGAARIEAHGRDMRLGEELLTSPVPLPPGALGMLFVEERVLEVAPRLRSCRLSLYAREQTLPSLESLELVAPPEVSGTIDGLVADPAHHLCLMVSGWAVDPFTGGEVVGVLLVVDGVVFGLARPQSVRADLASSRGASSSVRSGWQAHVSPILPGMSAGRLEAFGLLPGERRFALGGSRSLRVAPPD